jgi:hypothetical protein
VTSFDATSSSSISSTATIGIGVGCILLALLTIGLIAFFMRRRRKSRRRIPFSVVPDASPVEQTEQKDHRSNEIKQFPSDTATAPPPYSSPTNTNKDVEIFTDANRHRMEDTGMAATLASPWSAELSGRSRA